MFLRPGAGKKLENKSLFLPVRLKKTSFLFKEYSYNLNEEKGRFQLASLSLDFSCINSVTFMLVCCTLPSILCLNTHK